MPAPTRPSTLASRVGLSNQIERMPRIRIAAMIRLTPCFPQNWNRVPERLPMNSLRKRRNVHAINQAIAMKPTVRTSLWPFSAVAPTSVIPNSFTPCAVVVAAADLALLTIAPNGPCTSRQPGRPCKGSVKGGRARP